MNPHEAIEQLEAMQRQIVHGKRTFADIADCIRRLCTCDSCIAGLGGSVMTITFTGRCKGCGVSIIRDKDLCDECTRSEGFEGDSPLPCQSQ